MLNEKALVKAIKEGAKSNRICWQVTADTDEKPIHYITNGFWMVKTTYLLQSVQTELFKLFNRILQPGQSMSYTYSRYSSINENGPDQTRIFPHSDTYTSPVYMTKITLHTTSKLDVRLFKSEDGLIAIDEKYVPLIPENTTITSAGKLNSILLFGDELTISPVMQRDMAWEKQLEEQLNTFQAV